MIENAIILQRLILVFELIQNEKPYVTSENFISSGGSFTHDFYIQNLSACTTYTYQVSAYGLLPNGGFTDTIFSQVYSATTSGPNNCN
jgi:hypothetical protein